MNFNQYLREFHQKKHLIFDLDSNTSYAQLITNAYLYALTFKKDELKKIGILTQSPLITMTQILGAMIAGINMTLLSPKEPPMSQKEMMRDYKLDLIISSQYKIKDFEYFTEDLIDCSLIGLHVLSSGSSGKSKEIFLSLNNLSAQALLFIDFFKSKEADTYLINLPHHHVGGLMILWRAFLSGGSITQNPDSHSDYISLVPLQLQRLLTSEIEIKGLQAKKCILIGGAPFSEDLKQKARDLSLNIFETYGMSETASFVMLNGKALPGIEIRLNHESLIEIKSPTLSSSLKSSGKISSDGFFTTNDLGEKTKDNDIRFIQRQDIQFKSAGELINPLEIEQILLEDSRILNAVSTFIPHYQWTNAHALILETTDSDFLSLVKSLKENLKKKLHPHLVPKFFYQAKKNDGLFITGLKPKRYKFSQSAKKSFLSQLIHHSFIDNNKNETMVIFHGFMEESSDFNFIPENNSDYNFLLIDLPGHGKTAIKNFSSQDEIYFYLKELISLYTPDPILYGYSMGGRVAIELILRGLKITSLFLESANLGIETKELKDQRLESDLNLFKGVKTKDDLFSFLENWYNNPIFSNYNKTQDFKENLIYKTKHDHKEWQKALEYFSPGASTFLLSDTINALKDHKISAITGLLDTKYDELFRNNQVSLKLKHFRLSDVGHNPHKIVPLQVLEIIKKL